MEIVTIVCVILIVQSCSVYAEVDHNDEAGALLGFRSSLSGGEKTLSTWNVSSESAPCDWDRINCDYEGYVSHIFLGGVGIGGSINGTALTKLPRLEHLDLSYNSIGGTIPDVFQDISFSRLVLNNNQISGHIPCSLGSKHEILYTLQIKNNNLEGCIPAHLVNTKQNYFQGNPKLDDFCLNCGPNEKEDGHCCRSV